MTDVAAVAMVAAAPFGDVLRSWRQRRSCSQLALAAEAGVSQRHISFLETGRSNPSREMVVHLGVALEVPLRDRNAMLIAAGYAPVYAERSLGDDDLADIRRAIEMMLTAHEPFPAYVIDRHWNVVLTNEAASRLVLGLMPSAAAHATNIARLVLHPDGLRSATDNWRELAAATVLRLEREASERPDDDGLRELLDEVSRYPDMPDRRSLSLVPKAHEVLIPVRVTLGGQPASFFTTIATLASPTDVTLQELRIETLLPADAETEQFLRSSR